MLRQGVEQGLMHLPTSVGPVADPTKRKKRKTKDPNAPKRALSGYLTYTSAQRAEVPTTLRTPLPARSNPVLTPDLPRVYRSRLKEASRWRRKTLWPR